MGRIGGRLIDARVDLDLKPLGYLKGSGMNLAIRKSLNRAAAPVKAALQAAAPKKSGKLARSIKIKTKFYTGSKTWVAIIGPSRTGPKKVSIKKKAKRAARRLKKGILKAASKAKKKANNAAKRTASYLLKSAGKAKRALKGKKLTKRKILRALKSFKTRKKLGTKAKPKALQKKQPPKAFSPTRYAWQVEHGTKSAPAHPWLRPTLATTKGTFASILTDSLRTEIEQLTGRGS